MQILVLLAGASSRTTFTFLEASHDPAHGLAWKFSNVIETSCGRGIIAGLIVGAERKDLLNWVLTSIGSAVEKILTTGSS